MALKSKWAALAVVFAGIAVILFGVHLDAGGWSALLEGSGGVIVGLGVFGIDVDRDG